MYSKIRDILRWVAALFLALATTATIAVGNGTGMTPLAMGGGSVEDAIFQGGAEEEVTFSFFAGYDRNGNYEGSFHFRRGYPDGGVSVVLSTEITNIVIDMDDGCQVMTMDGIAKLIPNWAPKPAPGQKFTLFVWDCDSYGGAPDMIWFEVKRPNDNLRPGLSLEERPFIVKGNILIQ